MNIACYIQNRIYTRPVLIL